MNYTKGKWEYVKDSFNIPEASECSIGAIHGDVGEIDYALAQIYYDGGIGEETALANAHLIAAAPKLYKELKLADTAICSLCKALSSTKCNAGTCEGHEARLQTLAKAEGRE